MLDFVQICVIFSTVLMLYKGAVLQPLLK